MWVLTEAADGFDEIRKQNGQFLDNEFRNWEDYIARHSQDPAFNTALHNVALGTARYLKFAYSDLAGAMASGYFDTLRIGDGIKSVVQEDGSWWGIAQDALRALTLAGPVIKVGRFGLSRLAKIDISPQDGICTFVAAARALRLTGQKHFATVHQLLDTAGIQLVPKAGHAFPGIHAWEFFWGRWAHATQKIGMDLNHTFPVQWLKTVTSKSANSSERIVLALRNAIRTNNDDPVVFSIQWFAHDFIDPFTKKLDPRWLGHAMVAYWHPIRQRVHILDRNGHVYDDLAAIAQEWLELAKKHGTSTNGAKNLAANAEFGVGSPIVHVKNATPTWLKLDSITVPLRSAWDSLGNGFTRLRNDHISEQLAVEVRSLPFRVSERLSQLPARPATPAVPHRPSRPLGQLSTRRNHCFNSLGDGDGGLLFQQCLDYQLYSTAPGDTMRFIADWFYGDASLWSYLMEVNLHIPSPDPLVPGTEVLIPARE